MTASDNAQTGEPCLTMLQAYDAAWRFVAQFYERDGSRDERLWWMLAIYMPVTQDEPSVRTSDPAAWDDWQRCVRETLDQAPQPSLSPPSA